MNKVISIFIILLSISQIIFAQEEPIVTDRPDQTESSELVPKNFLQLEHGITYEKDGIFKAIYAPSTLVRYGVNRYFELRLVAEPVFYGIDGIDEAGFSPLEVGIKAKMVEEKGCIPSIAFLGHLAIPKAASDDFDITYLAPAFRFNLSHTLTDNFSIGYNLGAEWDGFSAEPTFTYTFAAGYGITDELGVFAEAYGFIPQKSDITDHRLDGGFTYLINNDLQLDLSAGWGYTDDAPDYFMGVGISYRFRVCGTDGSN